MIIDMLKTRRDYSVKLGHSQSVRHIEFTILSTISKASGCGFGYIVRKHTRRSDVYTIKNVNDNQSIHVSKYIIANIYEIISVLFKQLPIATNKRIEYGHPYIWKSTGATCSLCHEPIEVGQIVTNFTDNKPNKNASESWDGGLHVDCAEKTKAICMGCKQKCSSDTLECPLADMLHSGIEHFV